MNLQSMLSSAFAVFVLCLSIGQTEAFAVTTAGGSNGGGGYSVRCKDDQFYAMDYVATQRAVSRLEPSLVNATASNQVLTIILKRLEAVRPELAVSFADFLQMNQEEANTSTSRIWINGVHPLEKLTDQQRMRDLRNCLKENSDTDIFQAVVRRQFKNGITYNRDLQQLANLEKTGPLQVSFTYVHEWLRDFTDDADIIMEINYFLHSSDFYVMNREQIEEVFRRHGLSDLPGTGTIQSRTVDPLSVLKIEWSGQVATETKIHSFRIFTFLCPQVISLTKENGGPIPEMSQLKDCDLIHKTADGAVKDQILEFQPEEFFIAGSKVNKMTKQKPSTGEGPFLIFFSEQKDSNGQRVIGTNVSDLSQIFGPRPQGFLCDTLNLICGPKFLSKIHLSFVRKIGGGLQPQSQTLHHTELNVEYVRLLKNQR